jgi:hypothetical protein
MPIGERGAYWRHGVLCALLANINRNPKTTRAFTPAEFMPSAFGGGQSVSARTPKEEAKMVAAALKAAFKHKDARSRK